nr:bifunctional aspartokinase/homoserine dehydrogenase 1, chloroplastic-like [Tanacetum cinerariifolium]
MVICGTRNVSARALNNQEITRIMSREVHQRTGTTGVPGTANDIFAAVKYVGANVIMLFQASSERSMCFVVREKEVKAVAMALEARFQHGLSAGI